MCWCTAVVAAAAVLPLPAAVRHRIPDDHICFYFVEFDPSVFLLFVQTHSFFLRAPWQYSVVLTASICLYTSSVFTGMRGAKADVSRGEAPLLYNLKSAAIYSRLDCVVAGVVSCYSCT